MRPAGPDPRANDVLLQAITRGRGLEHAVVAQVRALIGADEHDVARSVAESLRGYPETRDLGNAVGGIVAYRQGYVELAWSLLREVPREVWTRHAAAEYARSGLAEAPEEALAEIRRLAAEDPPELRAKFWYDVLGPVFGLGASDEARAVFAIFDRHVREDDEVWGAAARHRDWMREWVAADPGSPTAPGTGRRTFAVLDYGHPSATRASANIGDHVQSSAALGHLVRHDNVRLHGDEQLVGLLERLRERTRPERRRHDVEADLQVITAHRDASIYQAIPEDTWTLAFGWYMHPLFNFRHAFPLHRNLRPIFVSFHCNKRSLLTPEAVEYLKRYGPVGCRDWTTVYLLHSIGVPAFFSGCLTTTIDAVFPDLESRAAGRRAGRLRRRPRRRGARWRHHLSPQQRGSETALVRRQHAIRARAARHLPQPSQRDRHLAPALLPTDAVDRRRRRLPPRQPLRRPVRRARRHRRQGVRRDAAQPRRPARPDDGRDRRGPTRGRGVRPVA